MFVGPSKSIDELVRIWQAFIPRNALTVLQYNHARLRGLDESYTHSNVLQVYICCQSPMYFEIKIRCLAKPLSMEWGLSRV
jgi:hypothetical protein